MIRKWLVGTIIAASLVFVTSASAQYTGPGGTGGAGGTSGGTGTPTYTNKSYGVNKGAMAALIGGGVAGGVLLLRHHHHTLTACVGPQGTTLDDGKDVYTLIGAHLTPGEHVIAAGKKQKSDTGTPVFQLTGVRKDLGRCEQPTTVSAQK